MIVLAVTHPVEDYDVWKRVYDEQNPVKLGHALFARVNRRVGEPNTVVVVSGFESVEKAQAFLDDPALKAAMDQAGVSAAPRIEMYEEVEAVTA